MADESPVVTSVSEQRSPESSLLDHVERVAHNRSGRFSVVLHLSSLRAYNRQPHHIRIASRTFDSILNAANTQLYTLTSGNIILMCKDARVDDGNLVIDKIRALFRNDPLTSTGRGGGKWRWQNAAHKIWISSNKSWSRENSVSAQLSILTGGKSMFGRLANFYFRKSSALIIGTALMGITLSGCASGPKVPASETLVNQAQKTVEILKNRKDLTNFNRYLKSAAGVGIFPAVYKAGFFVGAEGGNGVVIARDASGNWGYPAFYTLAAGSWGLQFGGQKSGVVFIMRSPGAVEAILKYQGKIAADASVAAGPVGTGLEGAVTTNLGGDIIAFADSKGLFGGFSVEGAAIIRRNDLNAEYYGAKVSPRSILIDHAQRNEQAENLRWSLIVR